MKQWLWLFLLPSLALAHRPASMMMTKDPIYIEVQPEAIVIYPEKINLPLADVDKPNNKLTQLLDQLISIRNSRYPILILRPGSVEPQRRLRRIIQTRGLELGFELIEGDIHDSSNCLQNPNYIPSSGVRILDLETVTRIFDNQTNNAPCDIEVGTNSITVLADNMVVTCDELSQPHNPFIQHLGHVSSFPKVFCRQPGSDKTYAHLIKCIYDWGIQPHGCWITDVATPIEVPANGRSPVYLECRGNRLFSITADASPSPFELADLESLDPAAQTICFLVRPDGFETFRLARKAAWEQGFDISCELQDESGPFAIGPDGSPLFAP